ncbi:MAG: Flp pilus assembly protein CpaB [Actinomycetes bacterium]
MVKRFIALLVSLALALVGTLVLVAYVRTAETRALAGEETVEVLVVNAEIPRGTPAEALAGQVRTEWLPTKVLPADAVSDLGDLTGLVAEVDLVPGEQVLATRFVEPSGLGAVQVPSGLLEVTVEMTPERAVGGVIVPGGKVAVVASLQAVVTEDTEGTAVLDEVDSTSLVLHKVLVTRVQRTQATSANPDGTPANENEQAPAGSLLVTLAVDAPSLETLVFAKEHGTVWLASEPDDAPEDGTRIVTRENIYR